MYTYKMYQAVGEDGLLANCDLMLFELSLQQTFPFDTDVIPFLY